MAERAWKRERKKGRKREDILEDETAKTIRENIVSSCND